MNEDQKKQDDQKKKMNAALLEMSKEELVQALVEATEHTKEITAGIKMLLTHMKVLCHRNGGSLSYTKDEFEATAKDNPDYMGEEYITENGIELCVMKIRNSEKTDLSSIFNK